MASVPITLKNCSEIPSVAFDRQEILNEKNGLIEPESKLVRMWEDYEGYDDADSFINFGDNADQSYGVEYGQYSFGEQPSFFQPVERTSFFQPVERPSVQTTDTMSGPMVSPPLYGAESQSLVDENAELRRTALSLKEQLAQRVLQNENLKKQLEHYKVNFMNAMFSGINSRK